MMRALMTALIASCLITAPPLPASETKLRWTPETIMTTRLVSDVQIAPDHASVLYVVTEPKMGEKEGSFLSRIYQAKPHSKEEPVAVSADDFSSMQPRWSPDGRWIAFLSVRQGVKHLYLVGRDGGEAKALIQGPKDVQTFCWSPDGSKIALVMADETEAAKRTVKTSLAYVYGQPLSVNRLWLLNVFSSDPTLKPLTPDGFCVRGTADFGTVNTEFDWSPDAKKIVFAHSPSAQFDSMFLDSSLATVEIESGTIAPFAKNALFEALPRYSPDGRWIAYVSGDSPRKYSLDRRVAIRSLDGKRPRLLAQTFDESAFLAGPNLLGWTKEGRHLLYFEPKGTKFHLVRLPVNGDPAQRVETGDLFFKDLALSQDRSMVGFVVQSPTTAPEAFIAKVDDFTPTQVSHLNEALSSYPRFKADVISWQSEDGKKIEGLLTYPVDYEPTRRYPLLLVIHGGPMAFFDETFVGAPYPYPVAAFAQEGFLVLRPNPRGSCGYGKGFRHGNYGDWGGADYLDIMAGVDSLIAKGMADPERLGVMGWSYGGYMTAWTITQTTRFKAASMGAGLSNLVSMNGTTDLYRFVSDYLGDFTVNRKLYEERSPLYHVQNVHTPCLIQHGTDDKRVPVSQAYEFYHALNRLEKKTTLVLYPGMGHRLPDPNMYLDAMKRNLAWFQDHLELPNAHSPLTRKESQGSTPEKR